MSACLQLQTSTASTPEGRVAVVMVADDEVDLTTRAQLVQTAEEAVTHGRTMQPRRATASTGTAGLLVVNPSGVSCIDCAGLGALVAVVNAAAAADLAVGVIVERLVQCHTSST